MALKFNRKYDKITQKELVDDFLERLELGKDLKVKKYSSNNSKEDVIVIPEYKGYKEDGSSDLKNPIPASTDIRKKIKTRLIDILRFILQSLPASLIFNFSNIQVYNIEIKKGDTSAGIAINNISENYFTVYRAYIDRAQIDISNLFKKSQDGSGYKFSITVDTPFLQDDFITLYLLCQDKVNNQFDK